MASKKLNPFYIEPAAKQEWEGDYDWGVGVDSGSSRYEDVDDVDEEYWGEEDELEAEGLLHHRGASSASRTDDASMRRLRERIGHRHRHHDNSGRSVITAVGLVAIFLLAFLMLNSTDTKHQQQTTKRSEPVYPSRVVLLGERHSGVDFWLHQLQACYPNVTFTTNLTRETCWFQGHPTDAVSTSTAGLKFVVVVRSPYTWMQAMLDQPFHMPRHWNTNTSTPLSWEDFVATPLVYEARRRTTTTATRWLEGAGNHENNNSSLVSTNATNATTGNQTTGDDSSSNNNSTSTPSNATTSKVTTATNATAANATSVTNATSANATTANSATATNATSAENTTASNATTASNTTATNATNISRGNHTSASTGNSTNTTHLNATDSNVTSPASSNSTKPHSNSNEVQANVTGSTTPVSNSTMHSNNTSKATGTTASQKDNTPKANTTTESQLETNSLPSSGTLEHQDDGDARVESATQGTTASQNDNMPEANTTAEGHLATDALPSNGTVEENENVVVESSAQSKGTGCQLGFTPEQVSPCQHVTTPLTTDHDNHKYDPVYELNTKDGAPFKNLMDLRNAKTMHFYRQLKEWWKDELVEGVPPVLLVHFEDSLGEVLDHFEQNMGWTRQCQTSSSERPQQLPSLESMEKDFVVWITQHADWTMENKLGYKRAPHHYTRRII